jgi:hypothetical protein
MLRWEDALAGRLRQAGWEVHDLDFGRMAAIREFDDGAAARAAAERDLPAGVPVRHPEGGFIVGRDGDEVPPEELERLVPRPTEEQLRARWIDDPDVRAWSRDVHAELVARLREVKRFSDDGDRAGARSLLSAMRQRITEVIAEAETDQRPAAAKMATSLRRLAGSAEKLDDELTDEQAC